MLSCRYAYTSNDLLIISGHDTHDIMKFIFNPDI